MKTTKMLKKNYEFRQVLTNGKYYAGNYLRAFIIKNNKLIGSDSLEKFFTGITFEELTLTP